MEKEELLERIVLAVLAPDLLFDDLMLGINQTEKFTKKSPEHFGREYARKLEEFAVSEERNYTGFRKFLLKNRVIFGDKYLLLENLNEGDIDYIFEEVIRNRKEARGVH